MRGGCTSQEMKQKSGHGCHSPWHSTSLHCPGTARSMASLSHPLLSVCLPLQIFFSLSAVTYRFQNVFFSFLFESMTLFFSLLFLLPGPNWKHWVVFKLVSPIPKYNQLPEPTYQATWTRSCWKWHLLNLQKSHYQNYSKFNLLSV